MITYIFMGLLFFSAPVAFSIGRWMERKESPPPVPAGFFNDSDITNYHKFVDSNFQELVKIWREENDLHIKITPEGRQWIRQGMPMCRYVNGSFNCVEI